MRQEFLPTFQTAIKKALPSYAKEKDAVQLSAEDLSFADIDNDGVEDIYLVRQPAESAQELLLFAPTSHDAQSNGAAATIKNFENAFAGFQPAEIQNSEQGWGWWRFWLYTDAEGKNHIIRFGEAAIVGGSSDCCYVELSKISSQKIDLEYTERTRIRLKIKNVIGFGER